MSDAPHPTEAVTHTVSIQDAATAVRDALAHAYGTPVLRVEAHRIRVPAGKAVAVAQTAARAYAQRIGMSAEPADTWASSVVGEIVVASLPAYEVPEAGLTLWRVHGRDDAHAEIVTQVIAGDPPIRIVADHDNWSLVCTVDGATGWVRSPDAGAWREARVAEYDRPLDAGAFVTAVEHMLGAPYVWGGTRTDGVDCSGLVQRASWAAGGPWLPRHSRALLNAGIRVAPAQVQAGDVLVLQRRKETIDAERAAQTSAHAAHQRATGQIGAFGPAVHPMHVAVVVHNDDVVHASRDTLLVVREQRTSLLERYRVLGARRVVTDANERAEELS